MPSGNVSIIPKSYRHGRPSKREFDAEDFNARVRVAMQDARLQLFELLEENSSEIDGSHASINS